MPVCCGGGSISVGVVVVSGGGEVVVDGSGVDVCPWPLIVTVMVLVSSSADGRYAVWRARLRSSWKRADVNASVTVDVSDSDSTSIVKTRIASSLAKSLRLFDTGWSWNDAVMERVTTLDGIKAAMMLAYWAARDGVPEPAGICTRIWNETVGYRVGVGDVVVVVDAAVVVVVGICVVVLDVTIVVVGSIRVVVGALVVVGFSVVVVGALVVVGATVVVVGALVVVGAAVVVVGALVVVGAAVVVVGGGEVDVVWA